MGTDVINIPKRSVYMEISEDEMSKVISKFNDFAKKNPKLVRSDIRGSLQPEKEFTIVLTDWFKIIVAIVDGRYCVTEYNDNGKAYTVKAKIKVSRDGKVSAVTESLSVFGEKEKGYVSGNVPAFKFWVDRSIMLAVASSLMIKYRKIEYIERNRENHSVGGAVDFDEPTRDILIDLSKIVRTKPVSTGKGTKHRHCYKRSSCLCHIKKTDTYYHRGETIVHPELPTRPQGNKTIKGLENTEMVEGSDIHYAQGYVS